MYLHLSHEVHAVCVLMGATIDDALQVVDLALQFAAAGALQGHTVRSICTVNS
jgi:hypothetical protein